MYRLPYETASCTVEPTEEVVLYSTESDNAFFDPWSIIPKPSL